MIMLYSCTSTSVLKTLQSHVALVTPKLPRALLIYIRRRFCPVLW